MDLVEDYDEYHQVETTIQECLVETGPIQKLVVTAMTLCHVRLCCVTRSCVSVVTTQCHVRHHYATQCCVPVEVISP